MARTLKTFYYVILSFLLLILFTCNYAYCYELYEVKWVNDGDTIVLKDGRKIRYIGINAPEIEHKENKAEPYGDKAKEFNKKLVYLQKVRLEFDSEKHDQYDRLLAYVYLSDGTFVNNEMIEKGFAYCLPNPPNLKHEKLFLKSQQNAMKLKKGIWQNWKENNGEYVANLRSKRFHNKKCWFATKISKRNIKYFTRKWDAFWEGYAPCKKCF
ncbi:MAG: thermonuclease family protein [Proteobacteria bacterium]|nr:thermonuclease family protein [Pseudomonadota bacterium]